MKYQLFEEIFRGDTPHQLWMEDFGNAFLVFDEMFATLSVQLNVNTKQLP